MPIPTVQACRNSPQSNPQVVGKHYKARFPTKLLRNLTNLNENNLFSASSCPFRVYYQFSDFKFLTNFLTFCDKFLTTICQFVDAFLTTVCNNFDDFSTTF
jgi:hypothetical protein